MANVQQRNWGIDCLRVLAMAMVVLLHLLSQGGVLGALGNLTFKGEFLWLVQVACFSSVNCFALISGYVGLSSKHKYKSIVRLWLQVVFYYIISAILYNVILHSRTGTLEISLLIKACLPVVTEQNWYFSSYFCLFFFMPVLNFVIENMQRRQLKIAFLFVFVIFFLLETISSNRNFGIQAGYSFLWLALMYALGAYIAKYDPFKKIYPGKSILIFGICTLLTFLSRIAIEVVVLLLKGEAAYGTKFITYTSPLIVFAAVFLLNCFKEINIKKHHKLLSFLSKTSFGVFLIHTTPCVYALILRGAFAKAADLPLPLLLVLMLVAAVLVYLGCSVIDFLRMKLFDVLRIERIIDWIISVLKNLICKIYEKGKNF